MRKKILTVDDSKTVRIIVRKAFRSFDCDIFEAGNGVEGLAVAAKELPDLILLDITMPVMDGVETLTKLKSDPQLKAIPVMMLTAEGGKDHVLKIAKIGVRDYIVKPFKEDLLIEKANRIIELKPLADGPGRVRSILDSAEILIVDDKPAIVVQIQEGLKHTPWKIHGVSSLLDAAEASTRQPPGPRHREPRAAGGGGLRLPPHDAREPQDQVHPGVRARREDRVRGPAQGPGGRLQLRRDQADRHRRARVPHGQGHEPGHVRPVLHDGRRAPRPAPPGELHADGPHRGRPVPPGQARGHGRRRLQQGRPRHRLDQGPGRRRHQAPDAGHAGLPRPGDAVRPRRQRPADLRVQGLRGHARLDLLRDLRGGESQPRQGRRQAGPRQRQSRNPRAPSPLSIPSGGARSSLCLQRPVGLSGRSPGRRSGRPV